MKINLLILLLLIISFNCNLVFSEVDNSLQPPEYCQQEFEEKPIYVDVFNCVRKLKYGAESGAIDLLKGIAWIAKASVKGVYHVARIGVLSIEFLGDSPHRNYSRSEMIKYADKQKLVFTNTMSVIKKAYPLLVKYFKKELEGKTRNQKVKFFCNLIGRIGFDAISIIWGPKGVEKFAALLEKNAKAAKALEMAKNSINSIKSIELTSKPLKAKYLRLVQDKKMREVMEAGYMELYGDMKHATSAINKIKAKENLRHIKSMIEEISNPRRFKELKAAGINTDSLLVGIVLSDIGKSPRALKAIIDMANKAGKKGWKLTGDAKKDGAIFFKAFLAHENYGIKFIGKKAKELGLSKEQIREVVKTIKNHNGPGTKNAWWEDQIEAMFGKTYRPPDGPEAIIATAFDRGDQGSLFIKGSEVVGGPRKIVIDTMAGGDDFVSAIKEGLGSNIENTLRQFKDLQAISNKTPAMKKAFNTDLVKDRIKAVEDSKKYMAYIDFPKGQTDFVYVNGKKISDPERLFKALAEKDKTLKRAGLIIGVQEVGRHQDEE